MTSSSLRSSTNCRRAARKRMETLLKKPEIMPDEHGRFDRHGKTLAKTAKKTGLNNGENNSSIVAESVAVAVGVKGNRGRPKGSKNKTSAALREQILAALDRVGGVAYLSRLAVENSSAFASLLGKVLPTTLTAESHGGVSAQVIFKRVIVYPRGHEHIEGVTPKQPAAPSPVSVENNDQLICVEKPSQNSASDDQ
jgi:hypothetical protein